MKSTLLLSLMLTAGLSAASAQATNLLQNGSFEDGSWTLNTGSGWMDVGLASTAITGWTLVNNNVAWSSPANTDGILTLDGIRSLDLTGMGNINPNGGVTQTISTIIGQTYTLNFDLGVVPAYGAATLLVQAGGTSQTFMQSAGGWQTYSLDFVAAESSTVITLSGERSPNTYYIGLDSVSVTAAVPEPETYALMLAGLGLVGFAARRRVAYP